MYAVAASKAQIFKNNDYSVEIKKLKNLIYLCKLLSLKRNRCIITQPPPKPVNKQDAARISQKQ